MELIETLTPIIISLIVGFFGHPVVNSISFFRRQNLSNATKALQLFDEHEEDFKAKFIYPDLKETCFYLRTGIKTNEKSIEKYIEFKNILGKNYTWSHVKLVMPHLIFEDEKIKLKVSKWNRNFVVVSKVIILTIMLIGLMFSLQFEAQSLSQMFLSLLTLIIPLIIGVFIASRMKSIEMARKMEKQLNMLHSITENNN